MSRCVIRVDNLDAAEDIRNARTAADASFDERRDAILQARLRLIAGDDLGVVLDELALGMFLADHLRAAAERLSPVGEAIDKARADAGHWDAGDDEDGDVW